MLPVRFSPACLSLATLLVLPGCLFVPRSQLTALKTKNGALTEQNQALLAQLENLKVHSRNTEDQLIRTEEELALLEEHVGLDRKRLDKYQAERDQLHEHFMDVIGSRTPLSPQTRRRLTEISEQHPGLRFDPQIGVSKLDTDILFDEGRAELKPGAEEVLRDLAGMLKSPEGGDLKVLVVGHTDDRLIARKPAREQYPDNFHLSAARALAVSDALRRFGLEPERLGMAGFGPHQPIAPNLTEEDRQKNRRVELFVMAPEVPVIGWVESTAGLY